MVKVSKGLRRPYKTKAIKNVNATVIQAAVRRAIHKTMETKNSVITATDGTECQHNNIIILNNNIMATTVGASDGNPSLNTQKGQRIGDQITLKGISIRGMVELNERYSQAHCRIFVVKAAKGDVPTYDNLWMGISANKLLDHYNTERYTIIKSIIVKLSAPNKGTLQTGAGGTQSGLFGVSNSSANQGDVMSRATKIFNMWIPGNKISKSGIVQYEHNGEQVKFHDFYLVMYSYSNYSTASTSPLVYNVTRINDTVIQLYFKDA